MKETLEVVILGGGNAEDIEAAILLHIIGENPAVNEGEPQPFDLNTMPDDDVIINFRFKRPDIYRLVRILQIPNEFQTYHRNRINGTTALCMLLRRLAYPNRLKDLQRMFSYSPQSMSLIINKVIEFIIENHGHLLDSPQRLPWLNREKMQYYAQAIHAKAGAIPNCWGFIDGTARSICRPSVNQEEYYSGHKRVHCIKYQSVLCPDGIIARLKGAWSGRRHDAAIFNESNFYNELEQVAVFNNDEKYVLYGDQAYGVRELLLCPYPTRENMPLHQQQFNASMKKMRIAVEWGFQKILSEFAFLDFRKNQKLLLQHLEKMYKAAVLITNCHTCLYGSQTSYYFNIEPPLLEEYFGR